MGLNRDFDMGSDIGLDQRIIEAVDSLKDEMIDSILELVRIDSVEGAGSEDAPFGPGVKQALLSALDISGRLGFDTVNLDNYIGYAQYGRGEDGYVCAIGHVDVVPVGDTSYSLGALPYGLAAGLLVDENPSAASFYQQRYEEMRAYYLARLQAAVGDIGNLYGGIEYGRFAGW